MWWYVDTSRQNMVKQLVNGSLNGWWFAVSRFFCRCLSGSALLPGCSCSNWNVWYTVYVDDGGSKSIITVLKPWFGDEHPFWCCDATRVLIHTIWKAEKWRDNASWLVTPCGSSMLATSTLKRAGWWPCSLPCRIRWSQDDPLDVLWPRYLLGLLGFLQHSGSPHLRQWSGKAWQRAMDAGYDNQAAGKVDSLANFRCYFPVSVSCPLSLCRLEILLNPTWAFALYKQKHEVLGGHFETLLPSIAILGLGLRQGGDDTLAEWLWLELTSWWFQILYNSLFEMLIPKIDFSVGWTIVKREQ